MYVSFCTDQFEEMTDFCKNRPCPKEKVIVHRKEKLPKSSGIRKSDGKNPD